MDATLIRYESQSDREQQLAYTTVENNPKGFRSLVSWSKKNAGRGVKTDTMLFCCETTGGYDRALCDWLYGNDLDIWRESALQIKRSMGLRKGKDDKADSEMIAYYALRFRSKATLYKPLDGNMRSLRDLFLYRQSLVAERRAKMVSAKEKQHISSKSKVDDFIYRDAQKAINILTKSIQECECRMLEIIKEDEQMYRNYLHLISCKGVGLVTSIMLIIYTDNFKGWNAKKMASYCGIAPFYESSGSSVFHKANTSGYSNRRLKGILTQAARSAITHNPTLRQYYLRMKAQGKSYGVILNNVNNKLVHILFSLVLHDCDFELDHETKRALRA
ncbi:transposase [uncultured Porphyromonas sp.]|uniref:IS110 family transposase n=1 Tax=uncultured Porphyromonas sp. TaxID=159274 RepID=UPI002624F661|nr:transposase [uncultured Porphyromonas sp.]